MQNIFPKTSKYGQKMHRAVIVSPVFAQKPVNLRGDTLYYIIEIIIEKQENKDFFLSFSKSYKKIFRRITKFYRTYFSCLFNIQ